MNERIHELKLEAAQWAKQNHQAVDPENLTKQEYERRFLMMTDKFAELIVRECITTIEQDRFGKADLLDTEYDDGYVDGMGYAERILKEHFGVEE